MTVLRPITTAGVLRSCATWRRDTAGSASTHCDDDGVRHPAASLTSAGTRQT
jgi:hypothetical protein